MAENKNKLEELNEEQLDNVAGGVSGIPNDNPYEEDENLRPSI